MFRLVILFFVVLLSWGESFAQQRVGSVSNNATDSTKLTNEGSKINDSAKVIGKRLDTTTKFITPKKIALYSALLPGLGQYKNKQYWKIPIVYIGVGVAAYFYYDNSTNYNLFRREYAGRVNDPNFKTLLPYEFSLAQVQEQQQYYKKYLDMTVLISVGGYLLQIVDATVFAHLKDFDMTPDITMRLKPVAIPNGAMGIGLVFNLKDKSNRYGKNFGY